MKYELKQNYLTAGQVGALVKESLFIYQEEGLLDNYKYNPIDMEINFFAGLFYLVIKDYDVNDDDKFNELYNAGVQYELLDKITNARRAYDLMWDTAKHLNNIYIMLSDKINQILKTMPDEESLKEIKDTLPKEWQKVFDEYNKITGKNGDEL